MIRLKAKKFEKLHVYALFETLIVLQD